MIKQINNNINRGKTFQVFTIIVSPMEAHSNPRERRIILYY